MHFTKMDAPFWKVIQIVSRRDVLKRIIIIGVTLVAALVVVFLVWHGRTLTSSHHAVIRVRIDPHDIHGEAYTKQRQSRVDKVLPKLASILHEAGLIAVTDANTPFNTTTFGNNQDDLVLKFKGQTTGKRNTIPLEALVVVDSEEYETFSITLSEGYSEEPSIRLAELYIELDQALDPFEGNKYQSRLW